MIFPASIYSSPAASAAELRISGTVYRANGTLAKDVVVALVGSTRPRPMKNVIVDQKNKMFEPHLTVVTVGTKVRFPNDDTVFHNVFTEYHSSRFDFGMYPRGTSKSEVFDRAGLAVLLCSVHPDMSAYVMVVDTPFFAVTDGRGHFSINGVKPGSYQAQLWQESGEKSEGKVELNSSRDLKFSLHR